MLEEDEEKSDWEHVRLEVVGDGHERDESYDRPHRIFPL